LITLQQVTAPRRHPVVRDVSLSWGPGVHALVGAPADGGPLLLSVIAGAVTPGSGVVRVLEGGPNDPLVRGRIAHVPLQPSLPEELRVHEVLDLAASLRGEPARSANERLATLGMETLSARRAGSLSLAEVRAVALCEALTSARVRVLLVEEPFVSLDPRAASGFAAAVRASALDARVVLVATASLGDASELADDHVLLRGGSVAGQAASLEMLAGYAPQGAQLVVLTTEPAALLAALAREPGVVGLARRDGAVVARGIDALALAQAAGRAVLESGADVSEMRLEPPTIEDARAASAGIAKATYDAAYSRTSTALGRPVEAEPAP
jgi:ABC-2 type transport system ATP-binding protein